MENIVKDPDVSLPTPDDDTPDMCALLQIYPLEALNGDDCGVDVVMVGLGDWLKSRAREYQQRYAAALAEWEAWADTKSDDEWHEQGMAKMNKLEVKYDVHAPFFEETRFDIVNVLT